MAIDKSGIMKQYTDIASQYNQPVTYADSPVFQAGFEKWEPSGIGSMLAKGAQKIKSTLGAGTAATAAPFGSGMYVPPIESRIAEFSKYLSDPETAKSLAEADWATQFGHETSHLGWEYENLGKQWDSISPHWKTSASNPSYAGEEQWNYMHDLMYGPQYDVDVQGRPGEDYLTTKGLINPGDLSYTPKAYDVISKSGLIPEHKKAIGFGVNPFEDNRLAGQWYAMQKYKKMSQAKKQAQMQQRIRQAEAAKAAKKKVITTTPKGPPSITQIKKHKAPGGSGYGPHTKPKYKPPQQTGGGGGVHSGMKTTSSSRHKAPGGGGYGPHKKADGGLINFFKNGGFLG